MNTFDTCAHCSESLPAEFIQVASRGFESMKGVRDGGNLHGRFCNLICLELYMLDTDPADVNVPPELLEGINGSDA